MAPRTRAQPRSSHPTSSLYSYARVKCHGYIVSSLRSSLSRDSPHLTPHIPTFSRVQVPRLQAQDPPARQALGAHRVLRLAGDGPPLPPPPPAPPFPPPHPHLLRLAVHDGALPVQRRRTRRTGRRGGAPSAAAARTLRLQHTGSDAQRSPSPAPHHRPAPLPLQVYEEAFGSDTLLGEVTIEIARLATVKQKVAEWHGTSRDSDI